MTSAFSRGFRDSLASLLLLGVLTTAASWAQVRSPVRRISAFSEVPTSFAYGSSVASIRDPNGDGSIELLVGVPQERQVYIWSVHGLGQVAPEVSSLRTESQLQYGSSLAVIGDLDQDGFGDVAVGGPGRVSPGRVWILRGTDTPPFLREIQQITSGFGGLAFDLPDSSEFGTGVAGLDDLDGDGVPEIAVGSPGRDGNVHVLFMNDDGSVKAAKEGGVATGSLAEALTFNDRFGESVAGIGDLNGDGVSDLAVGAPQAQRAGLVFILFLTTAGDVKSWITIGDDSPALSGRLAPGDGFGSSIAAAGDADRDGVEDLLVGGIYHDDDRGAVWRLFLRADGTVKGIQEISNSGDGIAGQLKPGDQFGASVAMVGDINKDGDADMAVGSIGNLQGSIWILFGLPLPLGSSANLDTSPLLPSVGQEVVLTAHWGNGVSRALISFREGGSDLSYETTMQRTGSRYRGTIPSFVVDSKSFEYFVTVDNSDGSTTRVPSEGFYSTRVYVPQGLTENIDGNDNRDSYRLLSIPLEPDVSDARSVLERTLGPYDKHRWRFFSQDPVSGSLVELDEMNVEFEPGRAFWFLAREGGLLSTGSGAVMATAPPFEIVMQPERWNLVGNPYNFSVPVYSLRQKSGRAVDIMTYSGRWEVPDSLVAFQGYIVFNPSVDEDTLIVDTTARRPEAAPAVHPTHWLITIEARRGDVSDTDNGALVIHDARPGLDEYDRPEPPAVGDFVSVYFDCRYWGRAARGCRRDVRNAHVAGHFWDIVIQSSEPGIVDVSFGSLETIPSGYEAFVFDESLEVLQDLKKTSYLSLAVESHDKVRRLRLAVGPPGYLRGLAGTTVTTAATALQVYPNPFGSAATVRYVLDGNQKGALEVYDVLGRHLTTLSRPESRIGGEHSIVWDGSLPGGRRVSPGLYFISLEWSEGRKVVSTVVVGAAP